jgi:hypothetical protein
MANPAIALYLGETYATIGLFDGETPSKAKLLFEKSVFLPQVSLKNLLAQVKAQYDLNFSEHASEIPVFIVTKYFDRLKQFRLGGSISQIIMAGFENSYTLNDSKALSLAATQLIIPLQSGNAETSYLEKELERIKKINPDLNKAVVALPEDHFSSAQIETVVKYFTDAGLKIFLCSQPYNQKDLRKTLLNAGSEGTKEEIVKDFAEAFGENCSVRFFCHEGFKKQFENAELFNSSNNFFAHYIKQKQLTSCAYFDIETFKFLRTTQNHTWQSPWGEIPITHFEQNELEIHPFSEVKLDQLSMLHFENSVIQIEPGPMLAGRAIKPLVLDLFHEELTKIDFCNSLFVQLSQDNLKSKISNLFSVLEKGQKNENLSLTISGLKKIISQSLNNEIRLHSAKNENKLIGPISTLFEDEKNKCLGDFSWPKEILALAHLKVN